MIPRAPHTRRSRRTTHTVINLLMFGAGFIAAHQLMAARVAQADTALLIADTTVAAAEAAVQHAHAQIDMLTDCRLRDGSVVFAMGGE
ncbi:MAG: hypothetical protein CGU28_03185 [Candidatus Dactylopiibacterium carminicum]|uniref:Uncharacterized protein n=1 Tax=Candidatus Dactylopiibacterium carminicum TaxID=857335 RepID=A0A272EYG7_9RHOO|nr:hypothetical protein [Candidatus Dactylopiibacterium carminicum]KAF7600612.1 hypothetical protein BGI27_01640 [Candidatus Dactylopiibacterium carminicum]PAS95151.1 MAG: hypothetical protein CGU29_01525 [Candidatus Dactylopiibacterium carminicum]PAS97956.1 MAG: hypothetical protein CGU28_03185 [Candidatus Dactylopiibacterium carminicum]PAT00613.1 MAG: hypothetical protein BSR46_01650 [Candidatus Dactylopiibacterium carminicum]